jgi:hypothetical protein
MPFDIASITIGTCLRAPRIVLLGVEKIGKSSFGARANDPIFIPIKGEEGIDSIDVNKFPVVRCYDDLLACMRTLCSEAHDHQTVVIDSASTLEPIIWQDVCKREGNVPSIEKVGGGYGKGYTEALSRWRQITDSLDALREARGMASIIVGHVKVKRFDDPAGPSYDQYQFDINDKAANLLYRWADAIWFANTKVVVKAEDVGFSKEKHRGIDITGGARYLYTQKRPAHPGGGRGIFGQIPYELPLSWGSVMDAVQAVTQRTS